MSNSRDNDDYMLYRIARDYYCLDMAQKEIAKRESISRPHVSRLLKKARECGIVTIEVKKPNSLTSVQLAEKLKELTSLEIVEVATCNQFQYTNPTELSKVISDFAATNLIKYLYGSKYIGVGIGKTLYLTVKKMMPVDLKGANIIPLIGVAKKCHSSMQCNLLVSLLSDVTKSTGYFTNLPIVVDDSEQENELFLSRYRELQNEWEKIEVAIVGLGSPYKSTKKEFILNEATDAYKQVIVKSKNVGDLLTSYFRRDGSEIEVRNSYRRVAISIQQLSKVPNVICLAGGKDKLLGILTAIENKYINGLITDSYTASELIEILTKKKENSQNV